MKNFYRFAFSILEGFAQVKLQQAERRVEDLQTFLGIINSINRSMHVCPVCEAREREEDPAVH